jgi:uncharacterized protein (TIGR03435 family)
MRIGLFHGGPTFRRRHTRRTAGDFTAPAFEVASVKPSGPDALERARLLEFVENNNPRGLFSVSGHRFEARGRTVAQLIGGAYLIPVREIVGPSWMSDLRFDVEAVIPTGESPEKASEMLRNLLEVRWALKAHHEVRRMSGYALSIGKGGPKLTETGPSVPTNNFKNYVSRIKPGFNGTQMDHCDMHQLANQLAQDLKAPIEDQTGLNGHYSIIIQYRYTDWTDESSRPAILQDALSEYGLHLAARKVDAPVLVIDNISKTPTEN